jgi:hypothetical protein
MKNRGKALVLVMVVLAGCGGMLHQMAQPPVDSLPLSEVEECRLLAQSRGYTLAQFAGQMIVLNVVRSFWAFHLFEVVGVRCACALVQCQLARK